MSLITAHWSASGPTRLGDYHVEFALTGTIDRAELLTASDPSHVDWAALTKAFTIWKNDPLATPTDFGTWHMNHDPRDGSANIEIGALCMLNATTSSWGLYPFTIGHAWIMAGIIARIAKLKGIDVGASFDASVEPDVLQNGPIYNVSTHAERALQTQNPGVPVPDLGYFAYSGDPDCRWDLAVLDPSRVAPLAAAGTARAAAIASAAWLREKAHLIKAAGITNLWGLDA